ncbi:MAG: hypothetical protein H6810_01860 [Phycisphaeraceae bacterium]|nr:MAG: hypothetical protein H6810_01860 [Phycisphaeraceae bacterium]
MELWKLVLPEPGIGPCDAAAIANPLLLSGREVEAALVDLNPLAGAGAALPAGLSAPVAAVRSGRIVPESDDETDRVDASRRTWSDEGRTRFEEAWHELAGEAESRGVRLWLHPHAGDVIGDVPGLRALASRAVACGSGVLLEPAVLLTASMIPDAEDHFARIVEPLESSGLVRAVLVANTDGHDRCPIGEGQIEPGVLVELARRVAAWAPVAVLNGDGTALGMA